MSDESAAARTLRKAFLPAGTRRVAAGVRAAAAAEGEWTVLATPDPALDRWCTGAGVRHIDWLVLDGCADPVAALDGAAGLLERRRIDYVQFTQAEAGPHLAALYARLQRHGYSLFRFADRNLAHHAAPPQDGRPGLHLAVAPRHWGRLFARDHAMFRYATLFPRHGVAVRGVVHVGAHEGEEYDNYVAAGCRRVVFVEADPDTFARLRRRFAGTPEVTCIEAAVSDATGTATFTRMSNSQSSSLLAPKAHLEVYPHITVTGAITVETRTLPAVLAVHGVDPGGVNVLAIDAQGAELRILAGARPLLDGFDAIVAESSYAELYSGAGMIAEVDDLLDAHGFTRVAETSPHHHTWGDALYVRRR